MWIQRKGDSESAIAQNQQLPSDLPKVPDLFERVLSARGLIGEERKALFNSRLSELQDPFKIDQLGVAAERLLQASKANELICLYADFDLDGSSGLALAKTCLEKFGFKRVMHYQPRRLKEGYGFHEHVVEELKALDVKVIVTIDVGITSLAACQKAKDLGIDVILTDHHLPSAQLPNAFCIVNPNKGSCPSGLTYLSGAGVAFYLMLGLRRLIHQQSSTDSSMKNLISQIQEWDIKEVLDVFTIATLTDMVPLKGDNRILVKHGLVSLQNTKRPALLRLLEQLGFAGKTLVASDVAIRIAPKLNALSRMDMDLLPIHIYIEQSATVAEQLVSRMMGSNQDRVELQLHADQIAQTLIEPFQNKKFVFVFSEEFHRGIIGLVATKLSQQTGKPCFVGSAGSDGVIVGSARQPDRSTVGLVDALEFAGSALNRCGGHFAAAGFELHRHNVDSFLNALENFYNVEVSKVESITYFDTEATLSELSEQYFSWYQHIGPFGVGFPEPTLCFRSLQIESVRSLKGGHLKLSLKQANLDSRVEGLQFSPTSEQVELLKLGNIIDVIGEPQKNTFMNKTTTQLLIREARRSDQAG